MPPVTMKRKVTMKIKARPCPNCGHHTPQVRHKELETDGEYRDVSYDGMVQVDGRKRWWPGNVHECLTCGELTAEDTRPRTVTLIRRPRHDTAKGQSAGLAQRNYEVTRHG